MPSPTDPTDQPETLERRIKRIERTTGYLPMPEPAAKQFLRDLKRLLVNTWESPMQRKLLYLLKRAGPKRKTVERWDLAYELLQADAFAFVVGLEKEDRKQQRAAARERAKRVREAAKKQAAKAAKAAGQAKATRPLKPAKAAARTKGGRGKPGAARRQRRSTPAGQ